MSATPQTRTPLTSPKGLLALSIVWVYIGMWAYVIWKVMQSGTENPTEFLMEFAGATGVMGMIVILVVQNFFRKTEAG